MTNDDEQRDVRDHAGLVAAPLDIEAVQAEIVPLRLGHPFLYFAAIGSTNTTATELAREGAAEGTLVITDDQTAGRGRIGRTWRSLPGQQLALSLVLRPAFPPYFLLMASALAVAEAIEAVTGVTVAIKWPNDVLIAGRKVCGMLIETSAEFAVLGIGINVNGTFADDAELAARALTLADATGHTISRESVLVALLRRLDAFYAELQAGDETARYEMRARWRARLETLGRPIRIQQGEQILEGMAEDVDADGALLLRGADGMLRTVTWGEVGA